MIQAVPQGALRWSTYLLRSGPGFRQMWESYLASRGRQVLFMAGQGFDPRTCAGVAAILDAGGEGLRDCILLTLDEGASSSSKRYDDLATANGDKLRALFAGRGSVTERQVPMWSADRRRIGALQVMSVIDALPNLMSYSDVVVDISAMPRGIYFPLVGKLLYLVDHAPPPGGGNEKLNLHVIVAENPELDRIILDDGVDEAANYVHGFASELQIQATADVPKIWLPILGEGQYVQLERINRLVNPSEICPILPSPARNPRRSDSLLLEYRRLLFDEWRVEPRNVIYASEQNPFEVYRQIHRTVTHYDKALAPLGGCKAAITAVSSKLLSLGALLAAYELMESEYRVGIAHIESQGYEMNRGQADSLAQEHELFSLWLTGECYATG